MADPRERPTAEYIKLAKQHLMALWSPAWLKWREWDTFYHRTYDVWTKEAHKATRSVYRPSTPTSVIDHAADQQLAFKLRIHREPLGDSETARSEASALEVAMLSVLEDSFLQEPVLPFKQAGKHLLHYGYTPIDGPSLDPTELAERKSKKPTRGKFLPSEEGEEAFEAALKSHQADKRHWNPIRIKATHPARLLLPPLQKKPKMGLRLDRMYVQDLQEMARKKKALGRKDANPYALEGRDPFEVVRITSFFSEHWRAVVVDDGPLLWSEKNTWGYVPSAHAYAGFGMEPVELTTWNPSYLAQGLLAPIIDSLRNQAQTQSAFTELLMNHAYAAMGTSQDPAEVRNQLAEAGILQGEQSDFWVMMTQRVERWLFEVGKGVDADIQLGSYMRDAAGARQPGVTTVGQQAQLTAAMQRKFTSSLIQMEHLASITASRILRLCDLEGPFYANGKKLDPAHIHHSYDIQATFEVRDAVMELQMRELGLRELAAGVLDQETYWEQYAREENVTERVRRLNRQRVRTHPLVATQLAQEAAEQMGLAEEWRAMAEMEKELGQVGSTNGQSVSIPASPTFASGPGQDSGRELREPLSGEVAKPERIDLGG